LLLPTGHGFADFKPEGGKFRARRTGPTLGKTARPINPINCEVKIQKLD